MDRKDFDAVVVGSGPNGLAAAITMQREGLRVLLLEGESTIGGGMRTKAYTLPGFKHDICSTVHALGAGSPFFGSLPLAQHGLEYLYPEIDAAHPMDDGSAAILTRSVEHTASLLGDDGRYYSQLFSPLVKAWPYLVNDILAPLHFPAHPLEMARFGLSALTPALYLAKNFKTDNARALWAGMASHSIQPLSNPATSAFAMVLLAAGHHRGWPVAKGGSQSLADALTAHFISLGGTVELGVPVKTLGQVPSSKAVLFDLTPRQIMQIAGERFSPLYKRQLNHFRYGAGVFKVDWALDGPIPFTAAECRKAGTIHLGNTIEEIALYEKNIWKGITGDRPFVLLVQASVMDPSRAPAGKHTAWAYCHVPPGSTQDMTKAIESQIERFAPGFRNLILARHTIDPKQLEEYNNNYIGGDINGGVIDLRQLFTRPALRFSPYRTSAKGLYICSSSTPPGGGVHGMCGFHAAKRALNDVFHIHIKR